MCEHVWTIDVLTPADRSGSRMLSLKCGKCTERMHKLTRRSEKEILAEVAAQ